MRVLIVGCGYVGLALGRKLRQAGHEVFGLRRSQSADAELREAGITPVRGDVTQATSLETLPVPFAWVIHCAAAGGGGPEAYRRVYVEGTRNLLARLAACPPSALVYTSSTSVYGQDQGDWVTEASPTEPAAETGDILLQAEQLLREAHQASGFPALIMRLAGIYGPGRGYWLQQFLSGQATLEGEGRRYLNMIHRDDVAGAIVAGLERGTPGAIYNVVDDEPVTQKELFLWLSEKLGQPLPPRVPSEAALRKRGASHKRISNQKLKESLGYRLQFPTFREGFASVMGG